MYVITVSIYIEKVKNGAAKCLRRRNRSLESKMELLMLFIFLFWLMVQLINEIVLV